MDRVGIVVEFAGHLTKLKKKEMSNLRVQFDRFVDVDNIAALTMIIPARYSSQQHARSFDSSMIETFSSLLIAHIDCEY